MEQLQQPGRRKLRVLCLHSWRTSGAIFQQQWQRAKLLDGLADLLELVRVCCCPCSRFTQEKQHSSCMRAAWVRLAAHPGAAASSAPLLSSTTAARTRTRAGLYHSAQSCQRAHSRRRGGHVAGAIL